MRVRMARTETVFLEKGWEAAEFNLPDPSQGNQMVSLRKDVVKPDTKATVVMILCNHCPFVVHLKEAIIDVFEEYSPKGVAFVGISANSIITHPQDGPEEMAQQGYPFPYLFDETQEVAKMYNAACTPEFIVFDADLKLAYHGQFDSSRPSKYGESPPVTGEDVRRALDCILQGEEVPQPWRPSIGCNVKWNPGSEPAWYGAQ
ncbi:hypothetical protein M9434_001204 [Picochlorum sp. BPE23]|nr:hypothetical protein M9434_001204 [Picochlorum sp. BPE23]KAI8111948.1 hypothetical protein M9435_004445 [Picochlorum sp. BPE23]